jgi:hypothetical protein
LGFSVKALCDREHPLTLPALGEVHFKRYRNQVDDGVRALALVARRAAKIVVSAVDPGLGPVAGAGRAGEVRAAILRRHPQVDLDSLLEFAWEAGVPVIQIEHVQVGAKRFDGMAAYVEGRPVVVLASGRDGPPWLAFHLAHELGHILLGHVRPESAAVVDGSLSSKTGTSRHEREADRFACEVLAGSEQPSIADLRVDAARLAAIAAGAGPRQGVDPGVFVLIYAKSNDRWPVAQLALKYLGLQAGGRAKVAGYLARYLAGSELEEGDARFLGVLQAA